MLWLSRQLMFKYSWPGHSPDQSIHELRKLISLFYPFDSGKKLRLLAFEVENDNSFLKLMARLEPSCVIFFALNGIYVSDPGMSLLPSLLQVESCFDIEFLV